MNRESLEKEAMGLYDELNEETKRLLFKAMIQSIPTELLETMRNSDKTLAA